MCRCRGYAALQEPGRCAKLIEWLSSDKAQNLFADNNLEYPVNPRVKPDAVIAAWGTFKPNLINVKKREACRRKLSS